MKNLARKITCNFTKHYGYNTYMDIYYPKKPRERNACVLTLHSGGFYDGARDDELQMQIIEMLIKEGFVVASADYRLGMREWYKDHKFSLFDLSAMFRYCVDLAREDCERAVQFLLDKAEELKLDQYWHPKIVLAGCSSGAVAVLQTEYNRIVTKQKKREEYANYNLNSSNLIVKTAIAMEMRGPCEPAAIIAFSGSILCDIPFRFAFRPAPMLLVHGLKDKVIRAGNSWLIGSAWTFFGSKYIQKAALKANGACRVIWFNDGEHEVSMAMPKMAKEVTKFIDQSLRRNYLAESAGCGYSIRFNDTQYGDLDLEEEAKRWRGQTALGLIKANLQK